MQFYWSNFLNGVFPLLHIITIQNEIHHATFTCIIDDFITILMIWDTPTLKSCNHANTVYPKKYAHGSCFALLCCGYTLTDFPISIRLTSLALWQSNDCPSASKATLMNMDKYFIWIHYERLHNHNKAKHNKTVCIFLGIYCRFRVSWGITVNSSRPVDMILAVTINWMAV